MCDPKSHRRCINKGILWRNNMNSGVIPLDSGIRVIHNSCHNSWMHFSLGILPTKHPFFPLPIFSTVPAIVSLPPDAFLPACEHLIVCIIHWMFIDLHFRYEMVRFLNLVHDLTTRTIICLTLILYNKKFISCSPSHFILRVIAETSPSCFYPNSFSL